MSSNAVDDWDNRKEYTPPVSKVSMRSASAGPIKPSLGGSPRLAGAEGGARSAGPYGPTSPTNGRSRNGRVASAATILQGNPSRIPAPAYTAKLAWGQNTQLSDTMLVAPEHRVHVQAMARNRRPEALAENVVALKEELNRARQDQTHAMTEKRRMEEEMGRLRTNLIKAEELLNNRERTLSPTMGLSTLYRTPGTTDLIANLKDQCRQLRNARDQLASELTSLQQNIRATRVAELQAEVNMYAEELGRVQRINQVMKERMDSAQAAAAEANARAKAAQQQFNDFIGAGNMDGSPIQMPTGHTLANGRVRRTLQIMHQAHRALHSQAQVIRSWFPPAEDPVSMEEFAEKAAQRPTSIGGAYDVLRFLRSHQEKMSNELWGQPGGKPGETAPMPPPALIRSGSTKGPLKPSPSPSAGPNPRDYVADPALVLPVVEALLRDVRTSGADKVASDPGYEMSMESVKDLMKQLVREVEDLCPPGAGAAEVAEVVDQAATQLRTLRRMDPAIAADDPNISNNMSQLGDIIQLSLDEVQRLQGLDPAAHLEADEPAADEGVADDDVASQAKAPASDIYSTRSGTKATARSEIYTPTVGLEAAAGGTTAGSEIYTPTAPAGTAPSSRPASRASARSSRYAAASLAEQAATPEGEEEAEAAEEESPEEEAAELTFVGKSTPFVFGKDEAITVDFTHSAPAAKDWIAVYSQGQCVDGTAPSPSLIWMYCSGAQYATDEAPASGTVSFGPSLNQWPLAEGQYEMVLLKDDGYSILAGPYSFEVKDASPAGISFAGKEAPFRFEQDEPFTVRFNHGSATPKDWVTIYAQGLCNAENAPTNMSMWLYCSGTQRATDDAVESGAVTFGPDVSQWPLEAGQYEVVLLKDDGYSVLAGPLGFEVLPPAGGDDEFPVPELSLSPGAVPTETTPAFDEEADVAAGFGGGSVAGSVRAASVAGSARGAPSAAAASFRAGSTAGSFRAASVAGSARGPPSVAADSFHEPAAAAAVEKDDDDGAASVAGSFRAPSITGGSVRGAPVAASAAGGSFRQAPASVAGSFREEPAADTAVDASFEKAPSVAGGSFRQAPASVAGSFREQPAVDASAEQARSVAGSFRQPPASVAGSFREQPAVDASAERAPSVAGSFRQAPASVAGSFREPAAVDASADRAPSVAGSFRQAPASVAGSVQEQLAYGSAERAPSVAGSFRQSPASVAGSFREQPAVDASTERAPSVAGSFRAPQYGAGSFREPAVDASVDRAPSVAGSFRQAPASVAGSFREQPAVDASAERAPSVAGSFRQAPASVAGSFREQPPAEDAAAAADERAPSVAGSFRAPASVAGSFRAPASVAGSFRADAGPVPSESPRVPSVAGSVRAPSVAGSVRAASVAGSVRAPSAAPAAEIEEGSVRQSTMSEDPFKEDDTPEPEEDNTPEPEGEVEDDTPVDNDDTPDIDHNNNDDDAPTANDAATGIEADNAVSEEEDPFKSTTDMGADVEDAAAATADEAAAPPPMRSNVSGSRPTTPLASVAGDDDAEPAAAAPPPAGPRTAFGYQPPSP